MNANHQFKVGDKATYCLYTDCDAGYIVYVSKSGRTVKFQEGRAFLLNGPDSGEPDALQFSPGGFFGHTSGEQRWKIEEDSQGRILKFSLRKTGFWKLNGHGGKSPGCGLIEGHHHHYDYNF